MKVSEVKFWLKRGLISVTLDWTFLSAWLLVKQSEYVQNYFIIIIIYIQHSLWWFHIWCRWCMKLKQKSSQTVLQIPGFGKNESVCGFFELLLWTIPSEIKRHWFKLLKVLRTSLARDHVICMIWWVNYAVNTIFLYQFLSLINFGFIVLLPSYLWGWWWAPCSPQTPCSRCCRRPAACWSQGH